MQARKVVDDICRSFELEIKLWKQIVHVHFSSNDCMGYQKSSYPPTLWATPHQPLFSIDIIHNFAKTTELQLNPKGEKKHVKEFLPNERLETMSN
jgi:hypothetical protein